MKALLQRVSEASVEIDGRVVGAIGKGLLVLLGVEAADGAAQADRLARKVAALRIFEDQAGKINLSVREVGGSRAGGEPVHAAGRSAQGQPAELHRRRPAGGGRAACMSISAPTCGPRACAVATGRFGARMAVRLINDGPVTIWLDGAALHAPPAGG